MEELTNKLQSIMHDKYEGYINLSLNDNKIELNFDLLNKNFVFLLTKNRVNYLQTVYIEIDEARKHAKVWNEWRQVTWQAGIPSFGAVYNTHFSKGTSYNFVRAKAYKTTANGIELAYDANINTYNILESVKAIVRESGYKISLDKYTKIGLIVGLGTIVALLASFAVFGIVKLAH